MNKITYLLVICILHISLMVNGQEEQESPARWDAEFAAGYQQFSLSQFNSGILEFMESDWGLEKTNIDGGYIVRAGIRRTRKYMEQSLEFNYMRNGVEGKINYPVYNPQGDLTTAADFKYFVDAKTISYGIGFPLIRASRKNESANPNRLIMTFRAKLGVGFASFWRNYDHIYYDSGDSMSFETGTTSKSIFSALEIEGNRKISDRFDAGLLIGYQFLNFGDTNAQDLANYWVESDGVAHYVDLDLSGISATIGLRYLLSRP